MLQKLKNVGNRYDPKLYLRLQWGWYLLLCLTAALAAYITWSAEQMSNENILTFTFDPKQTSPASASDSRPVFTYVASYDNPPYEYIENGQIVGFNIDLIREIADNAGYRVAFSVAPDSTVVDGMRQGAFDVAYLPLAIPENGSTLKFLTTALTSDPVLLVPDNSPIKSFSQISGHTIGVLNGGQMHNYLIVANNGVTIVPTEDNVSLVQTLGEGKLDGVLIDSSPVGVFFAKFYSRYKFNIVHADIPSTKLGFAVLAKDDDLHTKLLEGEKLARANGTMDALSRRWLGVINNDDWWQSSGRYLTAIGLILILFSASIYWSRSILKRLFESAQKVSSNEMKYRTVIAHSPDGVLVFNKEGIVLDFNRQMENITGLKASEVIGRFAWELQWELIPTERRGSMTIDRVKESVLHAITTGEAPAAAREALIQDRQGNRKYISQVSFLADTGGDGSIAGAIVRDVTEAKLASDTLKNSEQKFRSLVESLPLAIFVKDLNSTYLSCNTNFARLVGIDHPSDIVGMNDEQLFPADSVTRYHEMDRRIISSGEQLDYEELYPQEDGAIVAWVTKAPLLNGAGEIIGIQGCVVDITDRKQIEDSLARSETRYHHLFEQMHDSFALFEFVADEDADGNQAGLYLADANQAFGEKFHFEIEKLVGAKLSDLLPEFFASWGDLLTKVATTSEMVSFEAKIKSENRYFRVNAFSPQQGHCAVIMEDITDARHAEAESRRTKIAVDHSAVEVFQLKPSGELVYVNETACKNLRYSQEDFLQMQIGKILPGLNSSGGVSVLEQRVDGVTPFIFEDAHVRSDGTAYPVEVAVNKFDYEGEPYYFMFAYNITERKDNEHIISQVNLALRTIVECNQILVRADDEKTLLQDICTLLVESGHYSMGWVGYAENDENKTVRPVAKSGKGLEYVNGAKVVWSNTERGRGPVGTAIRSCQPVVINSMSEDPNFKPWLREAQSHGFRSVVSLPLSTGTETFGALSIYSDEEDVFVPDATTLLKRMADDLAYGIQTIRNRRARLIAEEKLNASEAVFSNFVENLPAATVVVDEEGRILYQNAMSKKINQGDAIGKIPVDMFSPEIAAQINRNNTLALERHVTQNEEVYPNPSGGDMVYNTYRFAIPRGGMSPCIGVISVDVTATKRAERIAERSSHELGEAYEKTIEGWSRALDMRERETAGHSERVANLTIDFAKELGMPELELPHIRRGALLHDMGKIGIPDNILLKAGPLTEDEWVVMRKHPDMGYELLSFIPYLRRATDIPYFHHERWDGSGYPHGLKGSEIPLAARMFAYVDIWDALTTDRPYRRAYSKKDARAFFEKEAGSTLDPELLEIFLSLDEISRD